MNKQLKLTFVLYAVFTGIIMAWRTLMNFFSGLSLINFAGAGVNFVALLALYIILLALALTYPEVRKRTMDLLVIAGLLLLMEFIVYIPLEYGLKNYNIYSGFMVYQNVITTIGLVFFAYLGFRFVLEFKGVKLRFIEFILGNGEKTAKVVKEKKSKELENGSLEEKPNSVQEPNEIAENHEEMVEVETSEN